MTKPINVVEENWFPSLVWYADLSGSKKINQRLMTDITRLRTEVKSINRSNELGWHSPVDFHKRPEFAELCDCINGMTQTVAQSMKTREHKQFKIETLWVNINPENAYNALHDHPESDLSGVYYVCANENSGNLRFRDPRSAKRMNPWPSDPELGRDKRHWDRVSYKPVPGRLILFPSWLEHDVAPNNTNSERISISFNLHARQI